jgi:predicted transposase YbfD/YdcC
VAAQIISQEADYVLSLKGNQGLLHEEVAEYFAWAERTDFKDLEYDYCATLEKDHGRIEGRRCWVTEDTDWLTEKAEWAGLRSFIMVEAEREVLGQAATVERRYFISSLGADAKQVLRAVRCHWQVENSLHWVLDVAFREDACRTRTAHAPENLATLRHIAVNLLKQERSCKLGIKSKRLKAGWDESYSHVLLLRAGERDDHVEVAGFCLGVDDRETGECERVIVVLLEVGEGRAVSLGRVVMRGLFERLGLGLDLGRLCGRQLPFAIFGFALRGSFLFGYHGFPSLGDKLMAVGVACTADTRRARFLLAVPSVRSRQKRSGVSKGALLVRPLPHLAQHAQVDHNRAEVFADQRHTASVMRRARLARTGAERLGSSSQS